MENEKLTRKQIIPMIVGVLTLVILVASATYAYFSVTAGNTSGTTTITGDIGGDTLGTVTLAGGNTELHLGVSAYDMSEPNKGKVYYSSTTEGSRETSVANAGKTTYTATLSEDDTDSVMYACDYEFTVTSTGTALGKEATKDIELVFNGDIEKTINLTGTDKVSGTWYGFKNSNKERAFNAYLQLTNTEVEQNDIAGTDLSVSISNTKWKCYLSELDELVGEAYALYTLSDDRDYAYDLTFIRSTTPIKVGDMYNGKVIDYVVTGFETEYYSESPFPSVLVDEEEGYDYRVRNITFEDEIRPISTSYWFQNMYLENIVLTNLNTSLVTNMSHMFASVSYNGELDLSVFDTSKVTDMSFMFLEFASELYAFPGAILDLSDWNVSNVTNMSGMFSCCWSLIELDLSGWDTSNVINMSSMFGDTYELVVIYGIENWDVSNVTNMSGMFLMSNYLEADLSKWNVSNVTKYDNFGFSNKIIKPTWPTN